MQRHELAGFFFQMYKTKNQEIVKKFWKYIAIAAVTAVMVPFTACDDDSELGPKDKANYEANFAYCLESDNSYSTMSYRYSGNIIETDEEILKLVPVRLTKPAATNVDIEISIDPTLVDEYNAAKGTNYEALTDVSVVNPTIKIAQGQFLSTDSIQIDLNGNSGFVENGNDLLLPVVIKAASNGITISKTSRVFLAFHYSANVVSVEGALYQAGADESLWAEKMANLEIEAISSIFTADANTTVKFEIDNSLIDKYNKENDTEYLAWEGLTLDDAVIIPGERFAKIHFNVSDYSQLETGYVVPVRISSIEGDGAIADEDARVAYFVICKLAPTISGGSAKGTELKDKANWDLKVNGSNMYGSKYWRTNLFDGGTYSYADYWNPNDVVEINLGEVKTVTCVAVQYYAWYYGVQEYVSVRTSEDGVKWTKWKNTPDYYGNATTNINFSYPVNTQYIELTIGRPGYSSNYGTLPTEIRVYGE